jgi:hypothetical protein
MLRTTRSYQFSAVASRLQLNLAAYCCEAAGELVREATVLMLAFVVCSAAICGFLWYRFTGTPGEMRHARETYHLHMLDMRRVDSLSRV